MKAIDSIRRDIEELDSWIEVGDSKPVMNRIETALLELELAQLRHQEFAGIVRSWALTNESKTILDALVKLDVATLPKATLSFLREQERCRQALDVASVTYRQARLNYDVSLSLDDPKKRKETTKALGVAQEALAEASYAWAVIVGTRQLLNVEAEAREAQR